MNSLNSNSMNLSKSIERLSSGLRINRAGDDAAGLTISEKLRGQVRGLNQAVRNAQDGISMIQTAEGGLNETTSILQRMRELSVQASNDTLTNTDRGAIASELTSLTSEIDRIANTTQFNTKNLLNGSMSTTLNTATPGNDLVTGEVLSAAGVVASSVDVSRAAANTTYTLTAANSTSLTLTATVGGSTISQTVVVNSMQSSAASSQVLNFSTLGVSISLQGYDTANGTTNNIVAGLAATANDTIVTNAASAAATFQVGGNANQTVSVSIDSALSNANNAGNSFGAGGTYANLSAAVAAFAATPTTGVAQNLMQSLDDAIADVSASRANLGAVQNRLEHTIENLSTSSENLTASESRIRDADMASEMVNFTRGNILQQAGTSILAQANNLPQSILSLLRG
jgi:flagellin